MNSKIEDYSSQNLSLLPKIDTETETLYLDNNSLTSLSSLPSSLNYLSATNNKLSFLQGLSLQSPYLSILNLSNNKLISIKGISQCYSLQELVLCNNFIGDEEILGLNQLTSLRTLDVSRNHLRSEEFLRVLKNFKQLEELKCKNNQFETWILRFSLEKLKVLDLEQNKLGEIAFEKPMVCLQKIILKQNRLRYFLGIEKCMNLNELDISQNEFKDLPDRIEETKLVVLLCNNNYIHKFPFIPRLEILDASNNNLIEIPKFGGKVQEVVLINNHLSDLPDLPSALSINVSFNQFRSLKCFRLCSSLQNLDLSNNPIIYSEALIEDLSVLKLRSLSLPDPIPEDLKEELIVRLPFLSELNKDAVPFRSLNSDIHHFRSSNYWDALSKSRLFPSCRSSMTGLMTPSVMAGATYTSIFSDMKQDLNTTGNSFNRYQDPHAEITGRFSGENKEGFNEKQLKTTEKRQKRYQTPQSSDRFTFMGNNQGSDRRPERNYEIPQSIRYPERGKSQGKSLNTTKKRICRKPGCKKHRKNEGNSTVLIENQSDFSMDSQKKSDSFRDQGTSPFISRDFGTVLSSNIENTYKKINYEPLRLQKKEVSKNFKPKTENLSHIFTFARTPPRPVLTHESSSPLISQINNNSYEFSLVKHLLFLEGYNLRFLSKTYTHCLHRSLEMTQAQSFSAKDYNLLFYYNKEEVLKTVFTYNKGFEYLFDNFTNDDLNFSLSVSRTTCKLDSVNFILLCLASPGNLKTDDGYIFRCNSAQGVLPVYLLEFS
jgi:Leucine-rich repeat (LRR) protein